MLGSISPWSTCRGSLGATLSYGKMPQATGYSLGLETAALSGLKKAVDPLFSMQWNMEALTVLGLWSRHVVKGVARIRGRGFTIVAPTSCL